MPRRAIIVIICVAFVVVLVAGYIGATYNNSSQTNTEQSAQAARDSAISYIRANYPITENITTNLSWTGGKQNTTSPDTEYYVYNTGEWTVLLNCSAVSSPVYTVDANYTKGDVTLEWMGFCQNSTAIEQGFIVYTLDFQPSPVEQAHWDIFGYLLNDHSEVNQYFNFAGWLRERVTPEGLDGSETYRYSSVMYNATSIYPTGWVITVQYPVVPDPIFSGNITYTPSGTTQKVIDWQGTSQNSTVTETHYSYTP